MGHFHFERLEVTPKWLVVSCCFWTGRGELLLNMQCPSRCVVWLASARKHPDVMFRERILSTCPMRTPMFDAAATRPFDMTRGQRAHRVICPRDHPS